MRSCFDNEKYAESVLKCKSILLNQTEIHNTVIHFQPDTTMKNIIIKINIILLSVASLALQAQDIKFEGEQIPILIGQKVFKDFTESTAALADVDGDKDLDMVITGYNGEDYVIKLLKNRDKGVFQDMRGNRFEALIRSSLIFADIDSDGDQDFILTGLNPKTRKGQTNLYMNSNHMRFPVAKDTPFIGVDFAAIATADVDGDNDQDLVITGLDDSQKTVAKLYLNNGKGKFHESNVSLEGVARGSVDFADIDGDKDQDLLMTGVNSEYEHVAMLYKNDGSGNFVPIDNNISGVQGSAVEFCDVDNDNDPDVLITGFNKQPKATLYENDGYGNFSPQIGTYFEGVRDGNVSFGDIDNDGDNDVLIVGLNKEEERVSSLYLNSGTGEFMLASSSLAGIDHGTALLADVTFDGHLDVFLSGRSDRSTGITAVYEIKQQEEQSSEKKSAMITSNSKFEELFATYPNPLKETLVLELKKPFVGNYLITNKNGQKLLKGNIKNESVLRIDFPLPQGTYILSVSGTTGETFCKKLVKQ